MMLDRTKLGPVSVNLGCTVQMKKGLVCSNGHPAHKYGVNFDGEWLPDYHGHAVCCRHTFDKDIIEIIHKGVTTLVHKDALDEFFPLTKQESEPEPDPEPELILARYESGEWDYDDYFNDVDPSEYWHDDPDRARDMRDDR